MLVPESVVTILTRPILAPGLRRLYRDLKGQGKVGRYVGR